MVTGDDSIIQTNLNGGWPIILDPNELLIKAPLPLFNSHIFTKSKSIPPDNVKERLKDSYEVNALLLTRKTLFYFLLQ